jgi:NTE family protein
MKPQEKLRIIVLLFLLSVKSINAQKVALVLSGGGSDGLSHIGVLKALEQNHIPVDYIAGTSIGALIGGLYASGYSPSEIEKIASEEKFQLMSKGEIEPRYIYYFRKKRQDASWITFKFSPDTVLRNSLPTNIISPVALDFGLMELFARASASGKNNFDSLFIPFRCVAADITTKTPAVFSTGDLGKNIRASLSYPFYLKPMSDGKHLYVDGGLYNNFPVDIAYNEFKPDIIIGSNVSGVIGLPNEDDLISQIKSLLTNRKEAESVPVKMFEIKPKLKNSSLFDFAKVRDLIEAGYAAADSIMPQILTGVKRRIDPSAFECARESFRNQSNRLMYDVIAIRGIRKSQQNYVRRTLFFKRKKVVSLEELKPRYFRLASDDKIRSIYPMSEYNSKTGFYTLGLDVKKEKSLFVSFGGNFSSRPVNAAFVGAQYNILGRIATTLYANSFFGKFYGSYQLKSRFDIPFFIPFYTELTFTRNRFDFFRSSATFFEDSKPSFLVQNENFVDLSLAFPAGNKVKFVLGAAYANLFNDYYQDRNFSSSDTADRNTFNNYSIFAYFEKNTLNRKLFADAGASFFLRARYLVGEEVNQPGSTGINRDKFVQGHTWYSLKMAYETFYKSRGKLRLGLYFEGVFSNQSFFNNYTATILSAPAFNPIPESNTRFIPYLRANNYLAAGLKNVIRILPNFDMRMEAYLMLPYQTIVSNPQKAAGYSTPFLRQFLIGSGVFVYHTPIGPLSVSLNYLDKEVKENQSGQLEAKGVYSLLFSFGYILFNKRALD